MNEERSFFEMRKRVHTRAALSLLLIALTSCTGSRAFREARDEESLEHWDLAVINYSKAVRLDPKDNGYRVSLARAKLKASQFHFEKGKLYRARGRPELAAVELGQAVLLDPTNQYAEVELRKARDEAAKVMAERTGETRLETLKRQARGSRARPPILEPASAHPINLNFPQPKPIKQMYKALAEAVVEVALLLINTTKTEDLGVLLSAYQASADLVAPGGNNNFAAKVPDGNFTWDQLKDISLRSFGFSLPSITYSFIKNNTDAELLAKPQMRISEGQKAQLVIGDRVPIPTTTFNTGTTIGGNIVPVTSFQYQDVGIKIEVEPRVHHNKEVTLKLTIEVSNLNGFVQVQAGQNQPVIGTRTIASSIRLKDGETNLLAGLFRSDKSHTTNSVPFLGDIPILGRLFSKTFTDDKSTDLVLTLTPHIIRIPDVTADDL